MKRVIEKPFINKEVLIYQLNEARIELVDIISDLKSNSEFEEYDIFISLQHVYSHLNFAWNARGETLERILEGTDQDFRKWETFPIDLSPRKI